MLKCSRVFRGWLCLFIAMLFSAPITGSAQEAEPEQHLYAAGGAEFWPSPDVGNIGHGYGLLSYRRLDGWRGADLDLTYNTDTLMLTVRDIRISETIRLGGYLKGQVGFAGLLVDYYQQGLWVPDRGFWAGYGRGGLLVDFVNDPLFVQFDLGGRRWFFTPNDDTNPDLTLPPDTWVFEPTMRITYWNMQHDPSFTDPHRPYWRIRGWGLGLELASHFRQDTRGWGDIEGEVRPGENRNIANRNPIFARAWIRGGAELLDNLRGEFHLFASIGLDEDDLTRTRVGGMNPYVVQISGLPWAAYLPQNFGTIHLSAHYNIIGQHEIGVMFDAMQFSESDALRIDRDLFEFNPNATAVGIGLFGDFRWGNGWQANARLGWAPNTQYLADSPHLATWFSLGKQIF